MTSPEDMSENTPHQTCRLGHWVGMQDEKPVLLSVGSPGGSVPYHLQTLFIYFSLHSRGFLIRRHQWINPSKLLRMSGLEVAGAVLGAFPMALIAFEKYREATRRFGRFDNIRLEYKKYRDTLKFHHVTFTNHLRQVLLPLPLGDDMIEELLSAPGGDGWNEPTTANHLQKRLLGSYGPYLEYVNEIKCILDRIHRELAINPETIQQQIQDQVRINNYQIQSTSANN